MANHDDVLLAARVAGLAYDSVSNVGKSAHALGYECSAFAASANHVGLGLASNDRSVLAFRGSDELRDWATNLNLLPTRRTWGWSHRGFVQATELLWPQLEGFVRSAISSSTPILLTGHSLGGAMATVAALKIATELKHEVTWLITFAQPPLLGRTWPVASGADRILQYVRVINSVDAGVTAPFFPYYGHGQVRYVDALGKSHDGFKLSRFFADATRHGLKLRLGAQAGQHKMQNYLKALESAGDAA